ncbi:molybdopterin converting factor subunit 1 [Thioalbus denitrificans]|uniref:Molybdopterin synthase sulfur carrier subunit n=1 Tax=Thioalbus denitrificans TaxID=547122 RepID=A0A369C9J0_9GAMM|nr:molybdopterin converting factor subunit 1 [Thioalbus denitrificans]RCX30702.1 molybdopterin synthase subunit MoaD [Thioalbus denitrificans]
MIRILYFARLREQLGTGAETLPLPEGVTDVAGLRHLLQARQGVWSEALGGSARVLVAVNQEMAEDATVLSDGDEVAFFPPVTGG